MGFNKRVLEIDAAAETNRIVAALRQTVLRRMRRYGGVVGISGGVDSAVVLALALRAFGPQKVIALMLPENDSDPESEVLARRYAQACGVTAVLENITPALEGFGCYARRDEAIRRVFPEYDAAKGYKAKIVLPKNLLEEDTVNVFSLTIVDPNGVEQTKPLFPRDFLQIVAASNFKQRTRMAMLYYHAESNHYAVIGTANKNEHGQGFFVKHGDAGVDVQPIAHLYKTQVYQLAEYLKVPEEIRNRVPTTDTYSAPTSQQEFFFRLPFEVMDLLWFAQEHGYPPAEVAAVMGLTEVQVQRAYNEFTRKQRTTAYLRMAPVSFGAVQEGTARAEAS
ncbi:MAG TPA: NAD(+) synthase [Bryobacteraceae bacterium]|nr:NAD(+) synthase [Bryobacteraceae bacterium]HOL73633.1 NAD(+) synthase [Bryobacteraceae bacterium]HOQ44523.1 NAD(+) synthase [Bryobacteraceae bacterium]HPQ13616.1 NAD(+) synthase [Bryobacteraceae bacterium]HPU70842.1 NAD(+) synthase [Bryobacteraceae bacterium]